MTLSDDAYNKFMRKALEGVKGRVPDGSGWKDWMPKFDQSGWVEATPPTRRGQIIYTPYPCPVPPVEGVEPGTVWECHEYHESKMCRDRWELRDTRNAREWVRFWPSWSPTPRD